MRHLASPIHPLSPVALVLFAAGALLPGLAGCGGGTDDKSGHEQRVPAVEAVQARLGTLPLIQRLSGVVEARNQVAIHPEITSVVTDVLVVDGDSVERGQPLVRLRDTEFAKRLVQAQANHRIAAAQLRRAEAQAREAHADFDRLRSLAEETLASQAELEAGQARAETAEAEIELARARVDQKPWPRWRRRQRTWSAPWSRRRSPAARAAATWSRVSSSRRRRGCSRWGSSTACACRSS